MRITSAPSRQPVGASSVSAGGRAAFDASLHIERSTLPCIGAAIAATTLLAIQEDRSERRRTPPRRAADAATAGLEGLSILQRELLGCATASPADLERAAQDAEAHAEDTDDHGRRLCLAVALRLRVEIAKRQASGG